MNKMIQVRNVPEKLHRRLKARAAGLGLSLSDYILALAKKADARPPIGEILDELLAMEPVRPKMSVVDIIREERDRP